MSQQQNGGPIGQESNRSPSLPALTPAVRRRLQQNFAQAAKLLAQDQYDYDQAQKLLSECVSQDPGNPIYVDGLLQNLKRKYKDNKKGSFFAGFTNKRAFKKAAADKNWADVLQLGPRALQSNPWDLS